MKTDQLNTKLQTLITGLTTNSTIESQMVSFLDIAIEYDKLGQHASAFNSYLKYLDISEKNYNLLCEGNKTAYVVYLRLGEILEEMGNRNMSAKAFYHKAASYLPQRPEAYYYLTRLCERNKYSGSWEESLAYANTGILCEEILDPPPVGNEREIPLKYPGDYAIHFQRSVAASWVNQKELAKRDLQLIKHTPAWSREINDVHRTAIERNMRFLGNYKYDSEKIKYSDEKINDLKYKFPTVGRIHKNYSEFYQDMFVLSALQGKTNGIFIELGSGPPIYNNNTYLLEELFGWKGIALDINDNFVEEYNKLRKNRAYRLDAVTDIPNKVNYVDLLAENDLVNAENDKLLVDYLQIDCDPEDISLKALLNIPFDKLKFNVITFEHDSFYNLNSSVRNMSRNLLKSHGYVLVFNDVGPCEGSDIEDWYVHKDVILDDRFKKNITRDINQTPNQIFY